MEGDENGRNLDHGSNFREVLLKLKIVKISTSRKLVFYSISIIMLIEG